MWNDILSLIKDNDGVGIFFVGPNIKNKLNHE